MLKKQLSKLINMGPLRVLILTVMIVACSSEAPEPAATENQAVEADAKADADAYILESKRIPLIFDTDMAIDDWAALLFLQRHPDINLLALTIPGSGEAHCQPAEANALALLDMSAPESAVPVACGDPWPLDGYFVFPVPWQKDMDSLYEVPVTESKRQPFGEHAVELLHKTISESEEPAVILATGPLTNIAQWLEKYPEDSANVSRVVIMGGAIDAPGNIIVPGFTDNNPNKHAEWNFYIDPVATDIVLQSDLKIELVGLDVTNHVLVTSEFAEYFKSVVDNPSAVFWDNILDANDWFIDSNEYYFWDVLAALVVVDKETFCRGEMAALSSAYTVADTPWLATSDMSIPDTNWKAEPRQHLDAETAGVVGFRESENKNTLICRETNSKIAFDVFVDTIIDSDELPPQPEYAKPGHL